MLFLKVCLTSILSVVSMFLITKAIGYRQVSEMSMFDYINSITIGSIGAELAIGDDEHIGATLLAMVIFGIVTFFLSVLTNKSLKIRRFIEGCPIVLMEGGKIYFESLKKAHMDLSELLENCRVSGYFDISKLDTVILEANGKMSFIPNEKEKPVSLSNLENYLKYDKVENEISVLNTLEQENISPAVILDGEIISTALKAMGFDEKSLFYAMAKHDIKDIKDVFLATVSSNGQYSFFIKTKENASKKLDF